MKKKLSLSWTFILILLFSLASLAADKVVIIPLNSSKKIDNVITVSKSGGDFTDPASALDSITDATSDNQYLVLIDAGSYTILTTLSLKPYVTVAGKGTGKTKLTGSISSETWGSGAVLSGTDNAILRDLTVENTGGLNTYSYGILNDNASPSIQNVVVSVTGAVSNYGIFNTNKSSPSISDSTISVSTITGNYTIGIYNFDSSPLILNTIVSASGGINSNQSIVNDYNSSPIMNEITATALGGLQALGVSTANSTMIIENSTATATGGSSNTALLITGDSFSSKITTILRSILNGETYGIETYGLAESLAIQSSITGGITGSGTIICIDSDNGSGTPLDSNCAEIIAP